MPKTVIQKRSERKREAIRRDYMEVDDKGRPVYTWAQLRSRHHVNAQAIQRALEGLPKRTEPGASGGALRADDFVDANKALEKTNELSNATLEYVRLVADEYKLPVHDIIDIRITVSGLVLEITRRTTLKKELL